MLAISLILVLVGCGGPQQGIIGKWEQLSGSVGLMSSPGTTIEFFKEGTVSFGMFSGKYSWPDDKHLKIELQGLAFVYGATLNGDEITLTDSNSQVGVFKRYKSLELTTKNIAGDWKHDMMSADESGCVAGLGVDPLPDRMRFSEDGTFTIEDGHNSGLFSLETVNMSGQFSIQGDRIHIQASGTTTSSLGNSSTSSVQGEVNCRATLTYARLEFTNDQGKITLYHR